jgi:hypothetical protein
MFAELCVEKFFRKLAGMADLEDSLKKLDRLTQEEARIALSEVLKITHNTRDEVKVVDGKVEIVGDKVHCVDEKVQVVIDGARHLYPQSLIPSEIYTFRRQGSKRRGKGNKIDCSTGGKQHRRSQVFVIL